MEPAIDLGRRCRLGCCEPPLQHLDEGSRQEPRRHPGRETFAACLLIVSAVLGRTVMTAHPHNHELRDAIDGPAMVSRNHVVHALAIAAMLLQTTGAVALVLASSRGQVGLTHLAFVAQGTATAAVTIAAVCSGFVLPQFLGDAPMAAFVFAFNQAFAKLFVIAAGTAIATWSVAGWRRSLPGATSGLGVVVGGLAAAMVAFGHLRLDVHGMGAVVLGHSVWWVLVAIGMLRRRA